MRAEGKAMLTRVLVAGVLTLAAVGAAAQPTKIGFVNTDRIQGESVAFQRAMEATKREFAPREAQIVEFQKQIAAEQQRLEKEAKTLSAADLQARRNALAGMMRKSDQMVVALTEDYERRKAERAVKLTEEVLVAIKAVAEAGKFDLILQQAIYARSAIDVTDQVLKEMARRAGK